VVSCMVPYCRMGVSMIMNRHINAALYSLERWQEAMDVLKRFLELTDVEKSSYADERWNADFWIEKCEEHLGIKREPAGRKSGGGAGDEDTLGGITMKYR